MKRTTRRRAFTLMEMVTTIGIVTILFALGSATMISIFKIVESANSDTDRFRRGHLLMGQFRTDVHLARSLADQKLEHLPGDRHLTLVVSDTDSVAYRCESGRLFRIATVKGMVHEPVEMLMADVTFQVESGRRVIMIIEEKSGRHGKRKYLIEAALGGDIR